MRWFYFTQNEVLIKYYFAGQKRSGRDHFTISPVLNVHIIGYRRM